MGRKTMQDIPDEPTPDGDVETVEPKDSPELATMPKYKLTERAYIADVLYEVGDSIDFDGIPGAHMDPLNAAARAKLKEYPPRPIGVVEVMTSIGTPGANNGS